MEEEEFTVNGKMDARLRGHDIPSQFFCSIYLHTEIHAGTPSQGEGANDKERES